MHFTVSDVVRRTDRNMGLQLNSLPLNKNIKLLLPGGAGLASLVLFKSGSRVARIGTTMFGFGFGVGEAFRHTSTRFENEKKSRK
jgi:hypothetical protein